MFPNPKFRASSLVIPGTSITMAPYVFQVPEAMRKFQALAAQLPADPYSTSAPQGQSSRPPPIPPPKPKKDRKGKGRATSQDEDAPEDLNEPLKQKDWGDNWPKVLSNSNSARFQLRNTLYAHVKVVEQIDAFNKDMALCAGYLGFLTVDDFKAQLAAEEFRELMRPFDVASKANFGLPTNSSSFFINKFWKEVSDTSNQALIDAIESGVMPTDPDKFPDRKNNASVYACWAVTCKRVLDYFCTRGLFEDHWALYDEDTPLPKIPLFFGYTPEDLNRAVVLIKIYKKEYLTESRERKGIRTTSKKMRPLLPHFVQDKKTTQYNVVNLDNDDEDGNGEEEMGSEEAVKLAKAQRDLEKLLTEYTKAIGDSLPPGFETLSQMDRKLTYEDTITPEFMKQLNTLETEVAKIGTRAFKRSVSRSTHIKRPPLTAKAKLKFMKNEAKKTRVLWGPEDINQMRTQRANSQLEALTAEVITAALAQTEALQDEEEVEDPEDKIPHMVEQRTYVVRNEMAKQSAVPPGFLDALAWAGLTRDDLQLIRDVMDDPKASDSDAKISYKAHQVIGAAFMAYQEDSPEKASILAYNCGLGKTLTSLLLQKRQHERKVQYYADNPDIVPEYHPALLLVPGASVEVWLQEIDKCFPKLWILHQFYGTKQAATDLQRRRIIVDPPNIDQLNKECGTLDPKDPETGRHIIISAHTTWWFRTLGTVSNGVVQPVIGTEDILDLEAAEDGTIRIEYEEGDTAEDIERKSQRAHEINRRLVNNKRKKKGKKALEKIVHDPSRVFCSRVGFKFERVFIDEAHAIRNPGTYLSESIFQLNRNFIHFLTATPLLNHAKDLVGFLHQTFKDEWDLPTVDVADVRIYDKDFDPHSVTFESRDRSDDEPEADPQSVVPTDPNAQELRDSIACGKPLYLLNPRRYLRCGRSNGWTPEICSKIMPRILSRMVLRMGFETEIDLEDGTSKKRIGHEIPAQHIYFVQLAHNLYEKQIHDDLTLHLVNQLATAGDPTVTNKPIATKSATMRGLEGANASDGMVDAGIHRILKHGTFEPRLVQMTSLNKQGMSEEQKKAAQKERVNNWSNTDLDHGASFFLMKTRDGPQYPVYPDRLSMLSYMLAMSPKARYALGIIADNLQSGEKSILVFEYPMCLWYMEAILDMLDIEYGCLKSSQTQEERTDIIKEFNDKQSPMQVFMFTTQLGSVSLNLQVTTGCLILMELPNSFHLFGQIIGRVIRIGQEFIIRIYALWLDGSYDQMALHRIFRKIVASLAGEGIAAESMDPRKVASAQVQELFGMKESHCPLDIEWSKVPYNMKDRAIAAREKEIAAEGIDEPVSDPTGGPSTGGPSTGGPSTSLPFRTTSTPAKPKASKPIPRRTVVSPSVARQARAVVTRKSKKRAREEAEDETVPEPTAEELALQAERKTSMEQLDQLEVLRQTRADMDGPSARVTRHQKGLATKAYNTLFATLQKQGLVKKDDINEASAGIEALNTRIPETLAKPSKKAKKDPPKSRKPPQASGGHLSQERIDEDDDDLSS